MFVYVIIWLRFGSFRFGSNIPVGVKNAVAAPLSPTSHVSHISRNPERDQ